MRSNIVLSSLPEAPGRNPMPTIFYVNFTRCHLRADLSPGQVKLGPMARHAAPSGGENQAMDVATDLLDAHLEQINARLPTPVRTPPTCSAC